MSVAEALSRIENHEYDVVLCDLMMPGRNGQDLYETVQRERPALAKCFLFLSGGPFTPTLTAFAAQMGPRVISKPPDIDQLRQAIRALLPKPAGTHASPTGTSAPSAGVICEPGALCGSVDLVDRSDTSPKR
jgi:CheY-like chemotaxis protein